MPYLAPESDSVSVLLRDVADHCRCRVCGDKPEIRIYEDFPTRMFRVVVRSHRHHQFVAEIDDYEWREITRNRDPFQLFYFLRDLAGRSLNDVENIVHPPGQWTTNHVVMSPDQWAQEYVVTPFGHTPRVPDVHERPTPKPVAVKFGPQPRKILS